MSFIIKKTRKEGRRGRQGVLAFQDFENREDDLIFSIYPVIYIEEPSNGSTRRGSNK
jgi:hypothetical protein